MTGKVTGELEATIPVSIGSPHARLQAFTAVIDTGFNGYLTAPAEVVASLGLAVCGDTEAELGDGSKIMQPTYEAEVEWLGRRLAVPLLASEGGVLVGMSLMRGCDQHMHVEPEGEVVLIRG